MWTVDWLNTTILLYYSLQLSFWSEPFHTSKPVDIMISPTSNGDFIRQLDQEGMSAEVIISNVQNLIDEERKVIRNRTADVFDYHQYNTYETVSFPLVPMK